MNYILLDFEWDCFYCPAAKGFVNEILQFGAVKLNENFKFISTFSADVRSSLSKKLSGRFKKLTGITNEQMLAGVPLRQALQDYRSWAGEDCLTLTWSDTDLHVLHKNCELFLKTTAPACLGRYADLQKIFHAFLAAGGNPQTNQVSLENAARMLNIPFREEDLHCALDDSKLSAKILGQCAQSVALQPFIRNTNQPEFYKRLMYKPHYVADLNSPAVDKALLKPCCEKCGQPLQRLNKFKFINGFFRADFYCKACKTKYNFGVSFKQYYDRIITKQRFFVRKKRKKSAAGTANGTFNNAPAAALSASPKNNNSL